MAGTATRYNSALVPMGTIAQLWADLAVPSAGARLTLDADGTPDATANPNAVHLGHTDAGITMSAVESVIDFNADEVPYPIGSSLDALEVQITGSALQVQDEELLQILALNFGTYSTNTGYKQLTMGYKTSISYSSVAVIWPSSLGAGDFAVFQLYNARNTSGFNFQLGRRNRSQTDFAIKGYGLTARAAADQMGNYWWQIP